MAQCRLFDIDKVLELLEKDDILWSSRTDFSRALGTSGPNIDLRSSSVQQSQISVKEYYRYDLAGWQSRNIPSLVNFDELAKILTGLGFHNLAAKVKNLSSASGTTTPSPNHNQGLGSCDLRKGIKFGVPKNPYQLYGRDEELGKLNSYMFPVNEHRYNVVRVSGFGGIGKTKLIQKFLHSLQEYNIAWFSGADNRTLRRHLVDFAFQVFNIEFETFEEMEFSIVVRDILKLVEAQTDPRWVMVIDNVDIGNPHFDTLLTALQNLDIFVIVTTRNLEVIKLSLNTAPLCLEGLNVEHAVEFMRSHLKFSLSEEKYAIELCTILGGHPLTLEHCINYIREADYGISNFLTEFRRTYTKPEGHVLDTGNDLEEIMNVILKMALPKFKSSKVLDCLIILSLLPAENVPSQFLKDILGVDELIFTKCTKELRVYGLISSIDLLISTHRLVQFAARQQAKLATTEKKGEIFEAVIKWIQHVNYLNRKNAVHLTTLWENVVAEGLGMNDDIPPMIFRKLINASALREAHYFAMNSYSKLKTELGTDSEYTLSMEGLIYQSMINLGQYQGAVEGLKPLIARMVELFGADHVRTTAIRHDLARALYFSGEYADGLIVQLQLLGLRQNKLGLFHEDTVMTMHNAAIFLSGSLFNRVADALEIHQLIYSIRARPTGDEGKEFYRHILLFHTRSQIAFCKMRQAQAMRNDADGKRHLLQHVKAEFETLCSTPHLEKDDKEVLRVRKWLAETMNELGGQDKEMAESIAVAVLEDRIKVLGPDHPETKTTDDLKDKIAFEFLETETDN